MIKYTLPGSVTLLIVSIILFSLFVNEKSSYTGLARPVGKAANKDKIAKVKKESVISEYGKSNVPEIVPIVMINQDTAKPASKEEVKEPAKKEAKKKEKKKKKKEEIVSLPKEEITLVKADTFVAPVVTSPDTLSPKVTNDQTQDTGKRKKKKKKFLFF
jgi:hypothetical protein